MEIPVVRPVRASHSDAVVAAFEAHGPELIAFVRAFSRSIDDAEDLVQEAFARLVHEGQTRGFPEHPRAWLFTVCANLARSRARRRAVADKWLGWLPRGGPARGADQEAEDRATFDDLHRAVLKLPPDRRTAFLLAVDGFRGEEIAQIMGRSHAATRQLIWRARESLRAELGEKDRR